MIVVAIASVISFFVWLVRALVPQDRIRFVRNHLELGSNPSRQNEVDTSVTSSKQDRDRDIRTFTVKYLKQDGAFLLRLIAHNTNNITATEVACALWEVWKDRHDSQPDDWKGRRHYDDDVDGAGEQEALNARRRAHANGGKSTEEGVDNRAEDKV